MESDRNTTDQEIDFLAQALKTDMLGEQNSSLTESENETTKNVDTDQEKIEKNSNEVDNNIEDTSEDKGSSGVNNEGIADKKDIESNVGDNLNTQKEDSSSGSTDGLIDKEEYEKLKQELEEIKSKTSIDLDWVKSEEGQLYLRDLDSIDIDESAIDLEIERLVKEEGFTRKEAEEEVEDNYEALFDEDFEPDSKEYKSAERRLKNRVRKYIQALKDKKDKIEIPEQTSQKGQTAISEEEIQTKFEALQADTLRQRAEVRSQIADNLLKGRDKSTVKFGDIEIEYELSKEVAAKIKQDLTNLETIGGQYVNKDGSINADGLFQLLALKNDPETFMKIYASKKAAESKEEVVKSIKNTNFESKQAKVKTIDMSEDDPRYEATLALVNGRV